MVNEHAPDLLIDGTERRRQRPKDDTKQTTHYSGKKKAHTDTRTSCSFNEQTGKVVYLSPTVEGKKHDKKAADEAAIHFPTNATLGKDTGFQGYEPAGVLTN